MCIVSTPDAPTASAVPERQASRAPNNGDASTRSADQARRRLAMAASIFTPQATLGMPAVAAPGASPKLGA